MNESRRTAARLAYYRDLFLFWPLFLSSLVAGGLLFSRVSDDKSRGLACAAIAVAILLVAKRRLALVLGVLAFLASRFVVSVRRPTDWRIDIGMFLVGALMLWGIGKLHESRSFRRMLRDDLHEFSSDEPTLTDLLVNLAGLLCFFVTAYLFFR